MPVNPLVSRRPGVCDNALPTPASPGRTALGSSSRNLLSPGPDLAARCSDPWWPPSTRLPGPADFKATTLRVTGQDLALLSSRTAAERLRSANSATLFLVLTAPRPRVSTTLRRSRRRAVGRGHPVPFSERRDALAAIPSGLCEVRRELVAAPSASG